uniref:Uncharacterized protein n=1 Tax=viral metagenome TaxID=1070528 RepID=A0A6M3J0U0_9ZZZZ
MAIRSYKTIAAPTLAGGDLSTYQYHGFKMNTGTEYDVSLIASQYDLPLGVLTNLPDADGKAAQIAPIVVGDVIPCEVDTVGLSAGDYVGFNSVGELAARPIGHPMAFGRVWKAWAAGSVAEVFVFRAPGDSGEIIRKFQYDFADLGGAIAAITLTDDEDAAITIPNNAVIRQDAVLEALTTTTSGGSATIALGITGDDDAFVAATAMDNAIYAAAAATDLTAGVSVKTTQAVAVLATIAGATVTAGKFNVWVNYVIGD